MTHPKTLAVIRVFSSTDQKVLEKHAKIIEKLYGIPTRTYCIPNQPEGIANEEIAKDCVERIVEQCLRAEKDGADAVLVSCAIDPGVEAARKVCRIPIFGAGSCAAAMALTMGSRVGVLSLIAGDVPSVPRSILGDRMVAAVGIDDDAVDALFTQRVAGVGHDLHLHVERERDHRFHNVQFELAGGSGEHDRRSSKRIHHDRCHLRCILEHQGDKLMFES